MTIETGKLSLRNGGKVAVYTQGKGNGGRLFIKASDSVEVTGNSPYTSQISAGVDESGLGNGGSITIETPKLSVTNGGQIASGTFGKGNGGNISITASDALTISGKNSGIFGSVVAGAVGNGGNINITAGSLSLTNGGTLSSDVRGQSKNLAGGQGIGGILDINVRDTLTISETNSGIFGSLETGAIGRSGDIKVQAGNVLFKDGGEIISSTFGKGNAGNISITARDAIFLDGAYIVNNVQSRNAVGNGGNIDITTGSLTATNGAEINSFTRGEGNAGNITIQARDAVTFDGEDSGSSSSVQTGAVGNGGNINITAGSLSLTTGGTLNTDVRGQSRTVAGGEGIGGTVNINVRDAVTISGVDSGIFGSLGTGAIGSGGDIKIEAGNLFVKDAGGIISSTLGKGNAGNISITANDAISLDHALLANNVQSLNAIGNGGNIDIITSSLTATNGTQINSFTRGQGNAGNITIQARDAVTFDGTFSDGFFIYPSALFSSVFAGAVGNGGNINITAASLSLTNGGELEVSVNGADGTLAGGKGVAGTVDINARNALTISGADSGIFGTLGTGAIGRGGNIKIESGKVEVIDGGIISSRSTGTGTAGEIDINANTLRLNNAQINAQTAASDGGNINLNISDYLLLRNGSQISTTAGTAQAGGNGGNITINTPFIVAAPNENTDITANAFTGTGGNINIFTQNIFGIEARPKPSDQTNDITASSELGVQGQIEITQPEVQPTQGLIELPNDMIDASTKFSQLCPRDPHPKPLGNFIVTGRGSLPPSPLEFLTGTSINIPLATLDEQTATPIHEAIHGAIAPVTNPSPEIIEAQGWIKTADGIVLVANAPNATPSSRPTAAVCPHR